MIFIIFNLFEENNIEFIKRDNQPIEEVIHNIDDDYNHELFKYWTGLRLVPSLMLYLYLK